MRPIKFRAWDKRRKAMFAVMEVTFDAQYESGLSKVSAYPYDEWNPSKNNAPRNWVYLFAQIDNLELMQFTGLLDKNGKEIYEGDIVRTESTGFGVVAMYNGYWAIDLLKIPGDPRILCTYTIRGEVIGNIYEHKELLTQ